MVQTPSPLDGARLLYDRVWSGPPEFVASAPGRVNLIGEHTDYNDGFVLPMAIDRRTAVAVGPGPGLGCEFVSTLSPEPISVAGPPWLPQGDGSWTNYPLGVMSGIEQALDVSIRGLRIAVASDLPAGSGLSSSAALEAATARAIPASLGAAVGDRETARICQLAEHEFAGVRCGIMDQMASVFGGVVMLDARLDRERFPCGNGRVASDAVRAECDGPRVRVERAAHVGRISVSLGTERDEHRHNGNRPHPDHANLLDAGASSLYDRPGGAYRGPSGGWPSGCRPYSFDNTDIPVTTRKGTSTSCIRQV